MVRTLLSEIRPVSKGRAKNQDEGVATNPEDLSVGSRRRLTELRVPLCKVGQAKRSQGRTFLISVEFTDGLQRRNIV